VRPGRRYRKRRTPALDASPHRCCRASVPTASRIGSPSAPDRPRNPRSSNTTNASPPTRHDWTRPLPLRHPPAPWILQLLESQDDFLASLCRRRPPSLTLFCTGADPDRSPLSKRWWAGGVSARAGPPGAAWRAAAADAESVHQCIRRSVATRGTSSHSLGEEPL
jgi:hypothetical protein